MSRLPNAARAVINPEKFTRYCLGPLNRQGRHKARVFKAALGYDLSNYTDLISAIRDGILKRRAEYQGETLHGRRRRVDLPISGPTGRARVRTSWLYEKGVMSHGSRPHASSASDSAHRFRELACVQLRRDLPEHGLKRGEEGTIVHAFANADAYLVEFVDPADGSTRAELEVSPDDILPAAS